ncbi:MAG: hypothetical protein IPK15_12775 [Verrucomicrobia bacterium]|nr:hypothetical protein [Verrucomicrobiota bacterium]
MPRLKTPKRKWVVWLLAVGNLLAMPLVEEVYYETNLRRGAYPPEADSIGIPIMQFIAGWVVTLPVFLALIWFGFGEYPGAVSFVAFNKKRPFVRLFGGFLLVSDGL